VAYSDPIPATFLLASGPKHAIVPRAYRRRCARYSRGRFRNR
jgi:hypothetical protein